MVRLAPRLFLIVFMLLVIALASIGWNAAAVADQGFFGRIGSAVGLNAQDNSTQPTRLPSIDDGSTPTRLPAVNDCDTCHEYRVAALPRVQAYREKHPDRKHNVIPVGTKPGGSSADADAGVVPTQVGALFGLVSVCCLFIFLAVRWAKYVGGKA